MKRTFLSILFLIITVSTFSQEKPTLNIGAGFPFFFSQNFDSNSGGSPSMSYKRGNLFIEKPRLIEIAPNPNISIAPGVGYFLFNENENGGGLGGSSAKDYKHQAFSIYTKYLYEQIIKKSNKDSWYFGAITGVYFYSKTTGNVYLSLRQSYENISASEKVDRSGKEFFNSFYFGILGGLRIPVKSSASSVKPILEFSFYPRYANISDSYISDNAQNSSKSMMMLSLILEISTKKAAQN